jgi:hypothetical protein
MAYSSPLTRINQVQKMLIVQLYLCPVSKSNLHLVYSRARLYILSEHNQQFQVSSDYNILEQEPTAPVSSTCRL